MSNSPFSPDVLKVAREWQENPVLHDRHTLSPIEKPPYDIAGEWMWDGQRRMVVVKQSDEAVRPAREKIISDLAGIIGFPVPPVQIVYDPETTSWSSISLRAFTDSRDAPSYDILKADPHFVNAHIFDQWIMNLGRHIEDIVYDPKANPPEVRIAYIDNEYALGHKDLTKALPYFFSIENTIQVIYPDDPDAQKAKRFVLSKLSKSMDVQRFYESIESLSRKAITEVVRRMPNEVFGQKHTIGANSKQDTIEALYYRGKHIRQLVSQGLQLKNE